MTGKSDTLAPDQIQTPGKENCVMILFALVQKILFFLLGCGRSLYYNGYSRVYYIFKFLTKWKGVNISQDSWIFHPGKVSNFCWFSEGFLILRFVANSEQTLWTGKLFLESLTEQRFLCLWNISKEDNFPKKLLLARWFLYMHEASMSRTVGSNLWKKKSKLIPKALRLVWL